MTGSFILIAHDRAAPILRRVDLAESVSVADEEVDCQDLSQAEWNVGIAAHERLAQDRLLLQVLRDAVEICQ